MSEEKLYMVKNNEGKYWDFSDNDIFWSLPATRCPTTSGRSLATSTANKHGGHVVTFVEEPEKVVLSKEQAEIVETAHNSKRPASYIILKSNDEELLMNAYVNGYTVAKEKKYRVITPKSWWASENEPEYMHMNVLNGIENYKGADDDTLFTQKQLDLYGLNGSPFTKEEVTDDDND